MISPHLYTRIWQNANKGGEDMKREAYLYFVCKFHCFSLALFSPFFFVSFDPFAVQRVVRLKIFGNIFFFMWKAKRIQALTITGFCVNNLYNICFLNSIFMEAFSLSTGTWLLFSLPIYRLCIPKKLCMQEAYGFRSIWWLSVY